jgi:hypothetical protein
MRDEVLDLLQIEGSEPRIFPLSIPVTKTQREFYRETCAMVKARRNRNVVPLMSVKMLMRLCEDIREVLEKEDPTV